MLSLYHFRPDQKEIYFMPFSHNLNFQRQNFQFQYRNRVDIWNLIPYAPLSPFFLCSERGRRMGFPKPSFLDVTIKSLLWAIVTQFIYDLTVRQRLKELTHHVELGNFCKTKQKAKKFETALGIRASLTSSFDMPLWDRIKANVSRNIWETLHRL